MRDGWKDGIVSCERCGMAGEWEMGWWMLDDWRMGDGTVRGVGWLESGRWDGERCGMVGGMEWLENGRWDGGVWMVEEWEMPW